MKSQIMTQKFQIELLYQVEINNTLNNSITILILIFYLRDKLLTILGDTIFPPSVNVVGLTTGGVVITV